MNFTCRGAVGDLEDDVRDHGGDAGGRERSLQPGLEHRAARRSARRRRDRGLGLGPSPAAVRRDRHLRLQGDRLEPQRVHPLQPHLGDVLGVLAEEHGIPDVPDMRACPDMGDHLGVPMPKPRGRGLVGPRPHLCERHLRSNVIDLEAEALQEGLPIGHVLRARLREEELGLDMLGKKHLEAVLLHARQLVEAPLERAGLDVDEEAGVEPDDGAHDENLLADIPQIGSPSTCVRRENSP